MKRPHKFGRRRPGDRSTPPGEHLPILLEEVLRLLDPQPGKVIIDCTVGWAGHSVEILKRLGPEGLLIGLDLDASNLPRARERLEPIGHPFRLHHANFAGLDRILAEKGIERIDGLVADLGMSSMQVDDPERGFSYRRDGALDMRMDPSRGRSAAQILATISQADLAKALSELGDEPQAETIARAIVAGRENTPLTRTQQLAQLIQEAVGQSDWRLRPERGKWNLHPAARTFQALRILVNRELSNLERLLQMLPATLKPGAAAAIITFHSGEDRLVKSAFRDGTHAGVYKDYSKEPVRAGYAERTRNPRSRSAKLRWCRT